MIRALSSNQFAILDILDRAYLGTPLTGPDLLRATRGICGSVQGVHQTAASLVRRGYLQKERRPIAGYKLGRAVVYTITARGREVLAAERSLERQKGTR